MFYVIGIKKIHEHFHPFGGNRSYIYVAGNCLNLLGQCMECVKKKKGKEGLQRDEKGKKNRRCKNSKKPSCGAASFLCGSGSGSG
jgi:hypothetical protein